LQRRTIGIDEVLDGDQAAEVVVVSAQAAISIAALGGCCAGPFRVQDSLRNRWGENAGSAELLRRSKALAWTLVKDAEL